MEGKWSCELHKTTTPLMCADKLIYICPNCRNHRCQHIRHFPPFNNEYIASKKRVIGKFLEFEDTINKKELELELQKKVEHCPKYVATKIMLKFDTVIAEYEDARKKLENFPLQDSWGDLKEEREINELAKILILEIQSISIISERIILPNTDNYVSFKGKQVLDFFVGSYLFSLPVSKNMLITNFPNMIFFCCPKGLDSVLVKFSDEPEVKYCKGLSVPREDFWYSKIRNEVFVAIGGRNDYIFSSKCEKFILTSQKWFDLPSFKYNNVMVSTVYLMERFIFRISFDFIECLDIYDEEAGWIKFNVEWDNDPKIFGGGITRCELGNNPYQVLVYISLFSLGETIKKKYCWFYATNEVFEI